MTPSRRQLRLHRLPRVVHRRPDRGLGPPGTSLPRTSSPTSRLPAPRRTSWRSPPTSSRWIATPGDCLAAPRTPVPTCIVTTGPMSWPAADPTAPSTQSFAFADRHCPRSSRARIAVQIPATSPTLHVVVQFADGRRRRLRTTSSSPGRSPANNIEAPVRDRPDRRRDRRGDDRTSAPAAAGWHRRGDDARLAPDRRDLAERARSPGSRPTAARRPVTRWCATASG